MKEEKGSAQALDSDTQMRALAAGGAVEKIRAGSSWLVVGDPGRRLFAGDLAEYLEDQGIVKAFSASRWGLQPIGTSRAYKYKIENSHMRSMG